MWKEEWDSQSFFLFLDGKKYERGKNVDNAFIKQSSLAWVLETLHRPFFDEFQKQLKNFLSSIFYCRTAWEENLKMKHETMKHCQQSLNNLIGAAIAQLKTMRVVPGKI